MKKNTSIIIISLFTVVTSILLLLLVNKTINSKAKEEKDVIASSDTKEIMKIEDEKEITYLINDKSNDLSYSWTFKKDSEYNKSVKENLIINLDLGLNIDTNNSVEKIDNIITKKEKTVISFTHHVKLPTKATVRINVNDKYKDGEKLYLYYLNEETGNIEFIDKGINVQNGYVEFKIDHCSSYFLTASIVQEAVNNPKNINLVIIIMVVVVISLVAVTLFQSGRKRK
ncbi:MAG: hypothetical protein RSB41_03010 [Bacilli bacterium]